MSNSTSKLIHRLTLSRNKNGVLYKNLAVCINEAIKEGMLNAGDKLPTQRHIAQELGINLSTVTQAFRLLRDQGAIITRIGSGCIVATPWNDIEGDYPTAPIGGGSLDMTVNRPATEQYLKEINPILKTLNSDQRYNNLQDYQQPMGPIWVREAIAKWLIKRGVFNSVDENNLIVTQGAQHALSCILRATTKPGDVVLADEITYQGVMALCHTLGLSLIGVGMDSNGMRPEALDYACGKFKPRAVILIPTLHNPTAITIPAERRADIIEVLKRHNCNLIEDDVYRELYDSNIEPLSASMPDRSYYVGGFSKSVAPGTRIGFVIAPPEFSNNIAVAQRIDLWCPSPLDALVTTRLIEQGSIDRIINTNRKELIKRQKLLINILGSFSINTHQTSAHAWLKLPQSWTTSRFVASLRSQGVSVLGSDMFATDSSAAPNAVRINVAGIPDHSNLSKALNIIAKTLLSSDCNPPGSF